MSRKLAFFRNETAKKLVESMNNRPPRKETIEVLKGSTSLPHGYFYGKLIEEVGNGKYKARVFAFDNSSEDVEDHGWIEHPQFIDIDINVFEVNLKTELDVWDIAEEEELADDLSKIYRFQEIVTYEGHKWTFQVPTPDTFHYFEIASSVDENEYLATRYDNPIDRNILETDVTVYAMKHTLGTIPNSPTGKGEWAMLAKDGKYYLTMYSIFYGES